MELAKFIKQHLIKKEIPITYTKNQEEWVLIFGLGLDCYSFKKEHLTSPISLCFTTKMDEYLKALDLIKDYKNNDIRILIQPDNKYVINPLFLSEIEEYRKRTTLYLVNNEIRRTSKYEWAQEVEPYALFIILYDKSSILYNYLE